jgi:hypothetical protein
MALAIGFVIAAWFLQARVAENTEAPVSLLQTRSLVQQSHTVPNDFFEDAFIVPTAIGQGTNYHAEAQRKSQMSERVVASFDVGNNAIPLPAWAVEDARRSMNKPVALSQSTESRTASSPSSQENSSGAILTANSQPEHKVTLSQEREQASLAEAQSGIVQVDPVPAQMAEESTDLSELEILASETPWASQMPASGLQQSEDQYDIAARLAECKDIFSADCMKTKRQSWLPSPLSHHQRQQRVEKAKIYEPAARQSPRHDMHEITAQLTQLGEQSTQVQRPSDALNVLPAESVERQIPPSMLSQQEHSLSDGGALLALQQQEIERVERSGQQESVPNSSSNLPAEEILFREAQRLEENQQQLMYQIWLQQLAQLQNLEQQKQWEHHQSSSAYDKHGRDDMHWLETASIAEVRDYFNGMVSSENDVKDRTLGVESSSAGIPVGSQLQIPADVESPLEGTQLQTPAASTSAEDTSLEVQTRPQKAKPGIEMRRMG